MFFLLRNLNLITFQTSLKNLFIILLKKTVEGRTGPYFRLSHLGTQTPAPPPLKAKHLFLKDLTIQTGTNLAAEDTTILRQEQATDRICWLSEY